MVDVIGGSAASSPAGGRVLQLSDVLAQLGIGESATAEETTIATAAIGKAEGDVRRYLGYDPVAASRTVYLPLATAGYSERAAIWEASSTHAYQRRVAAAATAELQLPHIPLRASTPPRVWVDYDGRHGTRAGAFGAGTEYTEGTDFWATYDGVDDSGYAVCRDGILRSHGRWPAETGSVKVTYTAGYTEAELQGTGVLLDASPIYHATLEEALRRFKRTWELWRKKAVQGHAPGFLQSESLEKYSYTLASGVAERLMSSVAILPETRERLAPFRMFGELFI